MLIEFSPVETWNINDRVLTFARNILGSGTVRTSFLHLFLFSTSALGAQLPHVLKERANCTSVLQNQHVSGICFIQPFSQIIFVYLDL